MFDLTDHLSQFYACWIATRHQKSSTGQFGHCAVSPSSAVSFVESSYAYLWSVINKRFMKYEVFSLTENVSVLIWWPESFL